MNYRRFIYGCAVVSALGINPSAFGDDAAIQGFGTVTCATFANAYMDFGVRTEEPFFIWAQGFFSAWNMSLMSENQPYFYLSTVSIDSQKSYLRSYCDRHPRGTFMDAVVDMAGQFERTSRKQ